MTKLAKDMSPAEYEAKLAEIKRGSSLPAPPPSADGQKHARDMTAREQQEWLAEHKRRFRK
jgi:hypothetical protein